MADVLATYVILFIFFGAFLQKSGAGRFFIDLPLSSDGTVVSHVLTVMTEGHGGISRS